MDLPVKLSHTLHRHGGRITEITGIGHEIDRPKDGYSRDYWFYRGTTQWDDGTTSSDNIDPHCLCCDNPEGHQEICQLSELMMRYLNSHGEWREKSPRGWYAKRKKKAA